MSRNDAGSDARVLAPSQCGLNRPATTVQDDLHFRNDAAESGLTTADRSPRPVSPARVGLSPRADARQFNDPSNYLG